MRTNWHGHSSRQARWQYPPGKQPRCSPPATHHPRRHTPFQSTPSAAPPPHTHTTHRRHDDGGDDELVLQGGLDLADLARGGQVGGDQGGHQAHQDAAGADEQREGHGHPVVGDAQVRHSRHHQGGTGGLGKGAKQVGTHAGHIAHVVAHVVCWGEDGGGEGAGQGAR